MGFWRVLWVLILPKGPEVMIFYLRWVRLPEPQPGFSLLHVMSVHFFDFWFYFSSIGFFLWTVFSSAVVIYIYTFGDFTDGGSWRGFLGLEARVDCLGVSWGVGVLGLSPGIF